MGPRNKAVALLMAVVLACTSFAASAQQVNTSLSANPTATISTIDSIGTPLSNQEASEVRGEGILSWAVNTAVNAAVNAGLVSSATGLWSFLNSSASIPSVSDYYRQFGVSWTTAFLSIVPYWLKPQIVQ